MQNHRPFLTIAQEETRLAKRAAREAAAAEDNEAGPGGSASGGSGSKNKQIAIEELWKPAGSGIDFWAQLGVEYVRSSTRRVILLADYTVARLHGTRETSFGRRLTTSSTRTTSLKGRILVWSE